MWNRGRFSRPAFGGEVTDMQTVTRQIVGLSCVRCHAPFATILDGEFCPRCSCPVHRECIVRNGAEASVCSACGADPEAQAEHHGLVARAAAEVRREEKYAAFNLVTAIVVRVIIGLGLCAAGVVLGPIWLLVGWASGVMMAFVMVGLGVFLLVSVFFLRRGRKAHREPMTDRDKA